MSHELYDDASSAPRTLSPEAALHVALQARTDERDAARAELAEVRAELETHRRIAEAFEISYDRTIIERDAARAELARRASCEPTPGLGDMAPATAGPVSLAGARPAAVDAGHPAPAYEPSARARAWAEAVR